MNLERVFDFYAKSTETKVAYKEWRTAERDYESFLEFLAQNAESTVTAEALREGMMMLHKAHATALEALAQLLLKDRPPER